MSVEDHELLKLAATVTVDVRLALIQAASAHVQMSPATRDLNREQRAAARSWLERLAAVRRQAEVLGLDSLGDDFLTDSASALFDALEDSFLLAVSGNAEDRSKVLTVGEVVDRVEALAVEGTWDG